MACLSPADSGEFIVKNAKFVKINEDGISNLVQEASIFFNIVISQAIKKFMATRNLTSKACFIDKHTLINLKYI